MAAAGEQRNLVFRSSHPFIDVSSNVAVSVSRKSFSRIRQIPERQDLAPKHSFPHALQLNWSIRVSVQEFRQTTIRLPVKGSRRSRRCR
jgi:hypothetical protein